MLTVDEERAGEMTSKVQPVAYHPPPDFGLFWTIAMPVLTVQRISFSSFKLLASAFSREWVNIGLPRNCDGRVRASTASSLRQGIVYI